MKFVYIGLLASQIITLVAYIVVTIGAGELGSFSQDRCRNQKIYYNQKVMVETMEWYILDAETNVPETNVPETIQILMYCAYRKATGTG